VEAAIVALREQHPAWGARKLRARLAALGHQELPATSTVHAILLRAGLVCPEESAKHQRFQRFEHPEPNDLWQMDFKGHFPLTSGCRCHPLTVLDDHSRFSLVLAACGDELGQTVRQRLIGAFRRYGLPRRMLMDNGGCWRGDTGDMPSAFAVWLMRLGIRITHGRPFHPQTQGKEERFHRTLKAEVLTRPFDTLRGCQRAFDRWRDVYNLERPHQAVGLVPPIQRYRESPRAYPRQLPPIEYGPDDQVRKVSIDGDISFHGHQIAVSRALRRMPVGLRPTAEDGVWEVYFSYSPLGLLDLREPRPRVMGRRPSFAPLTPAGAP
jgi:transposase InsO family protein